MEKTKDEGKISYPIFKGLQRPFELMGLQGRYFKWAIYGAVVAFFTYIVTSAMMGFLAALIITSIIICYTAIMIITKRQKGLYSKKTDKGIFVYTRHYQL